MTILRSSEGERRSAIDQIFLTLGGDSPDRPHEMHDNGAFGKSSNARNGREYAANVSEAHTTDLVLYVFGPKVYVCHQKWKISCKGYG